MVPILNNGRPCCPPRPTATICPYDQSDANLARGDCGVLNEGPYIDEGVEVLAEFSAG